MKYEYLRRLVLVGKVVKVSVHNMWVTGMNVNDKDGGKVIISWNAISEKREEWKGRQIVIRSGTNLVDVKGRIYVHVYVYVWVLKP